MSIGNAPVGTGKVLPGAPTVNQKSLRASKRAAQPAPPPVAAPTRVPPPPRTRTVEQLARQRECREAGREAVTSKLAYWAPEYHQWPRQFMLAGIARHLEMSIEDTLEEVAFVIHELNGDLHDLARSLIARRPRDALRLAEVLAICEQLHCSGGLATEMDDTDKDKETGPMRLATLTNLAVSLPPAPAVPGRRK